MVDIQIHQLSSVRLPPNYGMRRDPPPRCNVKSDSFWGGYDSSTLIYDCWYTPKTKEVSVALPPPLNLGPIVNEGYFQLQGQALGNPGISRARHHQVWRYKTKSPPPATLTCQMAGGEHHLRLHHVDEGLAERRVLYTLSRNNDLTWIADWLHYHIKSHKADALVICDNGSDQYSINELAETVRQVPGLKAARIIDVPLPYGPSSASCSKVSAAEYLQTSLMNICKARFMSQARSILNVDIDELVVSPTGQSIFEATEASRFGFITFPGTWRYSGRQPPRHEDHIFRRPNDPVCATKYALRPDSFLARRPMQVHDLAGVHRRLFLQKKRFFFIHCRNISTSWKSNRSSKSFEDLTVDRAAEQVLRTAFQDQP